MATMTRHGGQGVVKQKWYNGVLVAQKKMDKQATKERDVMREYEICMNAQHPNIVKHLFKPKLEGAHWVIRMEYIQGESLFTVMFQKDKSQIMLTPATKASVIQGMCEGLLHLHNRSYVHQDLKPDNIMIEYSTLRPVIIDLGLAKVFRESQGQFSGLIGGSFYYIAPEARSGRSQPDQRSDVWAMGKVIIELLLDSSQTIHPDTLTSAWIKQQLRGNPYVSAVGSMLDHRPEHRPRMGAVVYSVKRAGDQYVTAGPLVHCPRPAQIVPTQQNASLQCMSEVNRGVAQAFPMGIPATGYMRRTRYSARSDGTKEFMDVKAKTVDKKLTDYDRVEHTWK